MNQKQFLSQAAVALTLMLCLTGCGGKKDMGSNVSPDVSPSRMPATVLGRIGTAAWRTVP